MQAFFFPCHPSILGTVIVKYLLRKTETASPSSAVRGAIFENTSDINTRQSR